MDNNISGRIYIYIDGNQKNIINWRQWAAWKFCY